MNNPYPIVFFQRYFPRTLNLCSANLIGVENESEISDAKFQIQPRLHGKSTLLRRFKVLLVSIFTYYITSIGLAGVEGVQDGRSYRFLPESLQEDLSFSFFQEGAWSVSTSASWITLADNSGSDLGSIEFSVAENDTGVLRVDVIQVGQFEYTVAQHGSSTEDFAGSIVYGVGANEYGQARANGAMSTFATPQFLMDGVKTALGGNQHSLYLMEDGTLWAYGEHGVMGVGADGLKTDELVLIDSDVVFVDNDISLTGKPAVVFNYIKTDGTLWRFTGTGDRPYLVASDVVKTDVSFAGFMYLTNDGLLYGEASTPGSWGEGRFGNGENYDPAERMLMASDVADMGMGFFYGAYVKTDGTLWVAGGYSSGVVGEEAWATYTNVTTYIQIAENVTEIKCGWDQILMKKTDGNLYGFGKSNSPVFGKDVGGSVVFDPILIAEDVESFTVSLYSPDILQYTLESGGSYIAGENSNGNLGIGKWSDVEYVPVLLERRMTAYPAYSYTLFVDEDGSAYVSGRLQSSSLPKLPINYDDGFSGVKPMFSSREGVQVSAGLTQVIVTKSDENSLGLGGNFEGLIDENGPEVFSTWEQMDESVQKIDQYYPHSILALGIDGGLWAHGDFEDTNSSFTSNDGWVLEALYNSPGAELVAENVVDFAAAKDNVYFVDENGDLWGFGDNNAGQLGKEDVSLDFTIPVFIDDNVARVSAGFDCVVYLKSDGALFTLGSDDFDQLGDGDAEHPHGDYDYSYAPIQIADDVVSISGRSIRYFFIKGDGTLWGFGYDYSEGINRMTSPLLLAENVSKMSGGYDGVAYISESGDLYGNGAISSVSDDDLLSPVLIEKGVSDVAFLVNLFYQKSSKTITDTLLLEAEAEMVELMLGVESVDPWIALTDASWIDLPKGINNVSTDELLLKLTPNTTPETRAAVVSVSGIDVRVTQKPFGSPTYVLFSEYAHKLDSLSTSGFVEIISNSSWSVFSESSWLTVTSPLAGTGNAKLSFSASPNTAPADRKATVTVAGREFVVTQKGLLNGFYFSDEPTTTSSLDPLADTERSSYAGLWLSDDGLTGKLIGLCVENDPPTSFVFDLTVVDESTLSVDIGNSNTATLTRDEFGVLSGTLPCVESLSFSKVVVETENEYTGFYEADSGDSSGAKIFVLVAPNGKSIAVAPDLPKTFATKGVIATDGSIVVSEPTASETRELRFVFGGSESGLVVETTFLNEYRAKLDADSISVSVRVGSIGDWSVIEDVDWLASDIASSSGSGTVTLTVEANTTNSLRIAEIQIGSETFTVRQHGLVEGQDLPFADWIGAYYLEAETIAMTSDSQSADLDMDGLSNEDEWKLLFDPTDFASRLMTSVEVDESGTTVSVWQVPEGVDIGLEMSINLEEWTEVDSSSEPDESGKRVFTTNSPNNAFYRPVVE